MGLIPPAGVTAAQLSTGWQRTSFVLATNGDLYALRSDAGNEFTVQSDDLIDAIAPAGTGTVPVNATVGGADDHQRDRREQRQGCVQAERGQIHAGGAAIVVVDGTSHVSIVIPITL